MSKSDTIQKLKVQGVVVVVRGTTKEEGVKAAVACVKGGIKAIEVAYTNRHASKIIEELVTLYEQQTDVCVGAGTVLDATTARLAIMAGAQYIVSPSFDQETAKLCNLYAIPYISGCMTVTEITTALEAGCEIVKLFPGSALSPKYISSIKAPIPQVSIMVTGGVNLNNTNEWLEAGVDAIGIGGEFNKLAAKGDFETITTMAQQYCEKIAEFQTKSL